MTDATANEIIENIIDNLNKSLPLYCELDPDAFRNNSIPPYFSGIGMHLRHTLDIFSCVIKGIESGSVDFTDRIRGGETETDQSAAFYYHNEVISELNRLRSLAMTDSINVIDDLGGGKTVIRSTIAGVLSQAHSHAIHHFACIGYLLHIQRVAMPMAAFGYNPTTPVL